MSDTLEERVTRLEVEVKSISDKSAEFERKLNAVFKRIDELKADMHEHELQMIKEINEIKTSVDKLSSDIKWYGRIPTLAFSSLSFIVTLLILLKMLGILKGGQ